MTSAEFLSRFAHVRQNGPRDWHVSCPAHDDSRTNPAKFSLHVTETEDRILIRCFAGCERARVLDALRLKDRDLFTTNGFVPALPVMTSPITVTEFAEHRRLNTALLTQWGWSSTDRGIAIEYRERDGSVWRVRTRTSAEAGQGFLWDAQKGKSLIPYGRWRQDNLATGDLWLVEGESDAVTAWHHRLNCLGIPGATLAKVLDAEDLAGVTALWIVQEPDQGGAEFVASLRAQLRALGYTGRAMVVQLPTKDLCDLHVTYGERFANEVATAQSLASRPLWEDRAATLMDQMTEPTWIVDDGDEDIDDFVSGDDEPESWIFPGLLPTGVLMLIHGEPRARKSLAGFELALSAATGTAPFGIDVYRPDGPIPTYYLQEEDPRNLTKKRLRRLLRERVQGRTTGFKVKVRKGVSLDDPDHVARLKRRMLQLGTKLLVLDAARRLSTKTDEGPTKVRELVAVLRELVTECGLTIIVVHHDVKPPVAGGDQRRRSQRASGGDWFAACECPVHVERVNETESLFFPEDYKFGADPSPLMFVCERDGDLIKALVGTLTTPEGAQGAGLRGRVLAWLRQKGPTGASRADMQKAGLGRWEELSRVLDELIRSGAVDSAPGTRKGSLRYFAVSGTRAPETAEPVPF